MGFAPGWNSATRSRETVIRRGMRGKAIGSAHDFAQRATHSSETALQAHSTLAPFSGEESAIPLPISKAGEPGRMFSSQLTSGLNLVARSRGQSRLLLSC